jgi:hypothetical protein
MRNIGHAFVRMGNYMDAKVKMHLSPSLSLSLPFSPSLFLSLPFSSSLSLYLSLSLSLQGGAWPSHLRDQTLAGKYPQLGGLLGLIIKDWYGSDTAP